MAEFSSPRSLIREISNGTFQAHIAIAAGPPLHCAQVVALQKRLAGLGFEPGPVDGAPGPQIRQAIRGFQKTQDIIANGFVSRDVLSRLSLQFAESC